MLLTPIFSQICDVCECSLELWSWEMLELVDYQCFWETDYRAVMEATSESLTKWQFLFIYLISMAKSKCT